MVHVVYDAGPVANAWLTATGIAQRPSAPDRRATGTQVDAFHAVESATSQHHRI